MSKTKLESLTEKRDQINAQIQALKSKEQAQKRKDETRRKILIGGMITKMLKIGDMPQERLNQLLDKYLDNDKDRAMFDLPPKVES